MWIYPTNFQEKKNEKTETEHYAKLVISLIPSVSIATKQKKLHCKQKPVLNNPNGGNNHYALTANTILQWQWSNFVCFKQELRQFHTGASMAADKNSQQEWQIR